MGNHSIDCEFCHEDTRGLSGVRGCDTQREANRCHTYQRMMCSAGKPLPADDFNPFLAELKQRQADLTARINAAPGWGAAVGAMGSELKSVESQIRSIERTPTPAPHPDDKAVDDFAAAMKAKLAKKRLDGRSGWNDPTRCSTAYLAVLLHEHVDKGDPVDVGNIAMMLHARGGSTERPATGGLGAEIETRFNAKRDDIAGVLESVAKDGLPGSRDLDVALEAIMCALRDQ